MVSIEEQNLIKVTLIRLGIKCNLVGYTYLNQGILLTIEDPNLVYSMDVLYKKVAKACGTKDPFRVKANMHNAISVAFNKASLLYINEMFGMEVLKPDYKPTSAEIIKLVAEFITLKIYNLKPKRKKKSA